MFSLKWVVKQPNRLRLCLALWLILIFGMSQPISGQMHTWFPEKSTFPVLRYDLFEAQMYSGIFYLHTNKTDTLSSYVPVNFGFDKTVIAWRVSDWTLAAGLGAASYTQFEIERYDKNTLRGGLLNIDYKASGYLYAGKERNRIRVQVFHRSSHLGDDYMLWKKHFELNDKSLSYEQIDLIWLHQLGQTDFYGGLGYAFSPFIFRERWLVQVGVQTLQQLNEQLFFDGGFDLKIQQENAWHPEVHFGAGIAFRRDAENHAWLGLDGYYGYLPYSTLDYGKVFWLGAAAKIYL